jgi:hypothetical protein
VLSPGSLTVLANDDQRLASSNSSSYPPARLRTSHRVGGQGSRCSLSGWAHEGRAKRISTPNSRRTHPISSDLMPCSVGQLSCPAEDLRPLCAPSPAPRSPRWLASPPVCSTPIKPALSSVAAGRPALMVSTVRRLSQRGSATPHSASFLSVLRYCLRTVAKARIAAWKSGS